MKKILLLVFIFCLLASANAQWISDPSVNNPVIRSSVSAAAKTSMVGTSDGNGNMFVAWIEARGSETTSDIYVQKILANGNIAFAEAGIRVGGIGNESNITMKPDGSGGVILVWSDTRAGNNDIWSQRISAIGNLVYGTDGAAICNTAASQTTAQLELISATEFVVVWRDDRDAKNLDLYANKFLVSNGSKVWANDLQVVSELNNQSSQQITSDGQGGFIVGWVDGRSSNGTAVIYAQRINSASDKLWGSGTPNNGIAVSQSGSYNNLNLSIAGDGAGGAAFAFGSTRDGTTNQNTFAQYVDASGQRWPSDLTICNASGNQESTTLVKAGSNYVVMYTDLREGTGNRDIYAQSFTASGSINWQTNGIPVVNATGNQPNSTTPGSFVLLVNGDNSVTAVWDDGRNGSSNFDIMAQRLNTDGSPGWIANGVSVGTATANQMGPVAGFSSSGKIILAWRDGRSGTSNAEIYASELNTNGTLPLQLLSLEAAAQGNHVLTRWKTAEERNTREFVVEKSADGSRFAAIGQVRAANTAGSNHYTFTDSRPLTGNSFYRLRSVDADGKFTYSPVVRVHFGGMSKPAISLAPNPASTMVKVQLFNFEGGRYQLRMLNASGASVMSLNTEIEKGLTVLSLQLSHLPAGSYWLQLMQNGKPAATPVRLQKQ